MQSSPRRNGRSGPAHYEQWAEREIAALGDKGGALSQVLEDIRSWVGSTSAKSVAYRDLALRAQELQGS